MKNAINDNAIGTVTHDAFTALLVVAANDDADVVTPATTPEEVDVLVIVAVVVLVVAIGTVVVVIVDMKGCVCIEVVVVDADVLVIAVIVVIAHRVLSEQLQLPPFCAQSGDAAISTHVSTREQYVKALL
jgi:hypothetical protein